VTGESKKIDAIDRKMYGDVRQNPRLRRRPRQISVVTRLVSECFDSGVHEQSEFQHVSNNPIEFRKRLQERPPKWVVIVGHFR